MKDELSEWLDPAAITPWHLVFAVLTVLASWIASNFARKGLLAVLARVHGLTPTAQQLAGRVLKYAIVLIGLGIGLTFLGASVQPLLSMAIVVGVVLVLALRGISNNFAAGILLQTRQPVHVGDEIECEGHIGRIIELNARSVVMTTRDGRRVHIPNSYLLEKPLVNHSEVGARRSEIEARVRGEDLSCRDLVDLITDQTAGVPGVHPDPAPRVLVILVAPDRITVRVRFWHDVPAAADTASAVVEAVSGHLRGLGLVVTVTSDLPLAPLTAPAQP